MLTCVDTVEAALQEAGQAQVTFMDARDRREAMLRLSRLDAQLTALRLRLLAVSDDVAEAEGARDVAALITHHTRTDAGANRRDLALAQALELRWSRAGDALADGTLNVAQARVITRALDDLPVDEVSADLLDQAEAHLVSAAAHFGPRELRVLGRRILEVVAPELYERHEAEQLAEEERRAWRRTSLVSTRLGDGTTRIAIHVPDAVATRLHTYLEAFTSPRHEGPGEADRIPADRKRGQAFCALLRAAGPRRLPVHGGEATTLVVTVPIDQLRQELGAGELSPSDRLSAGEVRRLACTARILPAVLGGKSEVLDLGRSARLFGPAQRKAMVVRDRHCRAEGCSIPAAWCEAHHRAHDQTFAADRLPNGDVRFSRRT